jgi:chromosome segregation ATPase
VFERVYYAKNDETDSLEITNKERCYIVDINETEKEALAKLQGLNETYEATYNKYNEISEELATANSTITERDNTISTLNEEISNHSTKIEELSGDIATLTQERDDAVALHTSVAEKLSNVETELATVTTERDTLATYKKNAEDDEKRNIIAGYTDQLPEQTIETYTENMDNYTAEDLDVRLTYELKKHHPEMFSKGTPPAYIPKDEGSQGGINAILAKYKK